MRKLLCIAMPLAAVALMASTSMVGLAQVPEQGMSAQNSTADWTAPPPGPAQSQQGYRDGIVAAKLDKLATRPIDPKVSHLYVHPPVKGEAKDVYRSGFVAGYQAALQHQQAS